MNWRQKVQLVLWTAFSICMSAFFSLIGLGFMFVRTSDLHKFSSTPGDHKPTAASVVLADMLVNWSVIFAFLSLVAVGGFLMTKELIKDVSTPPTRRRISLFLYVLLVFNLLILNAGAFYGGITYWLGMSAYFQP